MSAARRGASEAGLLLGLWVLGVAVTSALSFVLLCVHDGWPWEDLCKRRVAVHYVDCLKDGGRSQERGIEPLDPRLRFGHGKLDDLERIIESNRADRLPTVDPSKVLRRYQTWSSRLLFLPFLYTVLLFRLYPRVRRLFESTAERRSDG